MKLTALIIIKNDTTFHHVVLLLNQHFEEITVVKKCLEPARPSVEEKGGNCLPDIVFCEIESSMPNPFELITQLDLDPTNFIFISNQDTPLFQAIQFASLNYLTKPIKSEDFKNVVQKILKTQKQANTGKSSLKLGDKISLSTNRGYTMVDLADIVYINSSGNYCTLTLINGEKITLTKLIGDFERMLPENKFSRTHQSYIVNIKYISQITNEDGLQIVLPSGFQIPIARRRKKELFRLLGIDKKKTRSQKRE